MAESWHELLQNLWLGSSNYLNPSDFRSIFVKFAHQVNNILIKFAGYSQHDSHEMLAFMLDALHEDLNRVKDKPYIEMQECQEGEDENESSSKWWKNHIRRENSIIVDLFHGQYKSKITCPECKRISITYDPFMYLGIPIPSGQRLKLKYFPLEDIYNYTEIVIPVNENITIIEVKTKIFESKRSKTLNNIEKIEALMVKEKSLKREMKNDETFISYYEHDFEVIFYEKENFGPDYITFYVMPILLNDSERRKNFNRSIMYYVRPFQFNKSKSVRDLYYKIFLFYRKVLDDVDPNRNAQNFLRNLNDELYLKKEFELYLSRVKSMEDFHIRINILYNIPEHLSIMSGTKMLCEFCGEKCEYCRFKYDLEASLEKIYYSQSYKRPFILLCELRKKPNLTAENEIYSKDGITNNLKKDSLTLYDCLEAFSLEEKLEQDNAWYCNKCKKHQLAMKKLEIFKAPYILIVQIKRFKMKTNYAALSSLVNRKNDCLIAFPLDNLDLVNFVVGPEKSKAQYDLFAVSQHYGSLSGGHYTALCRNSGGWFKFDDESVYKESKENVVTNSAYLLFYKRKYI
jgi:ubiquitin carboxyl-terminal hydrolase 4/11/15